MKLHMLNRKTVTKTQPSESFTALNRDSMKEIVGGSAAYLQAGAYLVSGAYLAAYNQ